jgi:uncharacterized protein (TIGR00290 family)
MLLSWSGGKDSALALHVLRAAGIQIDALITTVTDGYERVSMHGVRRELLHRQAEAIGAPAVEARIPVAASNERYEQAMREALAPFRDRGITRIAFGDLFLEDVRAYRERLAASVAMEAVFPIWGRDTAELAREFLALGFRAVLVCVDPRQIARRFCGRAYDHDLLAELPVSADPCGERGEFHTFVHDGPMFREPIAIRVGERLEREGFCFCDVQTPEGANVSKPGEGL